MHKADNLSHSGTFAEQNYWSAAPQAADAHRVTFFSGGRSAGVVALGTIALAIFDVALFYLDAMAQWRFNAEDGLVENLTFVLWLTAGLYVLTTLPWRRPRWLYAVLALGMIWVAGEEISWGQRLFAISTPQRLAALNEQHELNLHNIVGIHERIKAVGLVLIMGLFLAAPVLCRISHRIRLRLETVGLSHFQLDVLAMVVLALVLMMVPRALAIDNVFDEVGELALGSAFLLFAFDRRSMSGQVHHPRHST